MEHGLETGNKNYQADRDAVGGLNVDELFCVASRVASVVLLYAYACLNASTHLRWREYIGNMRYEVDMLDT